MKGSNQRGVGMIAIAITATAIFRNNPVESNGIWYDIGCAAQALDLWGPECLAHDEARLKGAGMALGGGQEHSGDRTWLYFSQCWSK